LIASPPVDDPPIAVASLPPDPTISEALPPTSSPASDPAALQDCVDGPSRVALYVHVYDAATRQEANRIDALKPFADAAIIAGIEDVVRTAQARGSKPPLRWARPTLLVHRREVAADERCAGAIATALTPHLDAWYGPREPAIDIAPLPASIRSDRHVIELWLPPADRRQVDESATSE
jgi:hypothetical protein